MRGRKPGLITSDGAVMKRAPKAPTWFTSEARAEWRRIMPDMMARRILADADFAMVEAFCIASGRIREIEAQIRAAGLDPKLLRAQNQLIVTARQIAAELGLTPVSRSRAGVREDPDADSPSPLDF